MNSSGERNQYPVSAYDVAQNLNLRIVPSVADRLTPEENLQLAVEFIEFEAAIRGGGTRNEEYRHKVGLVRQTLFMRRENGGDLDPESELAFAVRSVAAKISVANPSTRGQACTARDIVIKFLLDRPRESTAGQEAQVPALTAKPETPEPRDWMVEVRDVPSFWASPRPGQSETLVVDILNPNTLKDARLCPIGLPLTEPEVPLINVLMEAEESWVTSASLLTMVKHLTKLENFKTADVIVQFEGELERLRIAGIVEFRDARADPETGNPIEPAWRINRSIVFRDLRSGMAGLSASDARAADRNVVGRTKTHRITR